MQNIPFIHPDIHALARSIQKQANNDGIKLTYVKLLNYLAKSVSAQNYQALLASSAKPIDVPKQDGDPKFGTTILAGTNKDGMTTEVMTTNERISRIIHGERKQNLSELLKVGSAKDCIEYIRSKSQAPADSFTQVSIPVIITPLIYARDHLGWTLNVSSFSLETLSYLCGLAEGKFNKTIPDPERLWFLPLIDLVKNLPGMDANLYSDLSSDRPTQADAAQIERAKENIGYITMRIYQLLTQDD